MSDCVTCPAPAPCSCSASQTCVLIGRSCNACGYNSCQDIKKSGGSNAGATAGQAIGGAAAGLLVAFLFYWFWWRNRHIKREQAHASNSAEKTSTGGKVRFGAETKSGSAPAPRRSRLMSRQIGAEEKGALADELAKEKKRKSKTVSDTSGNGTDLLDESSASWVIGHDSQLERVERPGSLASDEYSFRSSHSTMPIPIAYIPSHANSMSVADGNGLERSQSLKDGSRSRPSTIAAQKRLTVGASASPKIDGSPASPSNSTGSRSPKIAPPSRPERDPKLDLRLPKKQISSSSSSGFGVSSPGSLSPTAANSPAAGSRFSASTANSSDRSFGNNNSLVPPLGPSRTLSTISSASGGSNSHMSVMSHMSYILDPPQIVTANSAGRVNVVGVTQARAVAVPATPSANGMELLRSGSITRRDTTMSTASEDPFADGVSEIIGGQIGISSPTFGNPVRFEGTRPGANTPMSFADRSSGISTGSAAHSRMSEFSTPGDVTMDLEDSTDFISGNGTPFSLFTPNASVTNTTNMTSQPNGERRDSDLSIFTSSSGNQSRPVTKQFSARQSTTSYQSNHDSILEGMPFMAPPPSNPTRLSAIAAGSKATTPTSPYFPLPPPRSPTGLPENRENPFSDANATDLDVPLVMPERPFAKEGHAQARDSTSSAMSRVSSAAMSTRSGYASVLEGIPFQLNLGSDRGSMAYSIGDKRYSEASLFAGQPSINQEEVPPVPALPLDQRASNPLPPAASTQEIELPVPDEEVMQTPKPFEDAHKLNQPQAQSSNRQSSSSISEDALLAIQFADS